MEIVFWALVAIGVFVGGYVFLLHEVLVLGPWLVIAAACNIAAVFAVLIGSVYIREKQWRAPIARTVTWLTTRILTWWLGFVADIILWSGVGGVTTSSQWAHRVQAARSASSRYSLDFYHALGLGVRMPLEWMWHQAPPNHVIMPITVNSASAVGRFLVHYGVAAFVLALVWMVGWNVVAYGEHLFWSVMWPRRRPDPVPQDVETISTEREDDDPPRPESQKGGTL